MKNKIYDIAVIGAGASGMMAAAAAADSARELGLPVSVKLYDGAPRVGKKILVTGNGRCNLTNMNMSADYYRGSKELFSAVYSRFDRDALLSFFAQEGLYTKTDFAGRVYPLSNQAASVLDTLRGACAGRGVQEVVSTKITSVERKNGGFILNKEIFADRVIVACGGRAAPVHGSDGSGYKLTEPFGVKITPLYPALTALNIRDFTKALKGIRADGEITLRQAGKTIASARGEIQYTDYGLSGIPAMQISRFAAACLSTGGRELNAYVDSAPDFPADKLKEIFLSVAVSHRTMTAEELLAGFMPKRLGTFLVSSCSISPAKPACTLHESAMEKLAGAVKKTKYTVASVRGFEDAQVTAGGIAACEINENTMELKKVPGMYVCGEIADVDGDCGGYNLQWAFSSGAVAGKSVIEGIKNSASDQ